MRRNLFALGALCVALALTGMVWGGPGDGGDPTEGASYVGASACKKCHMKQHRSWKKMKHAKAFETLPAKYRTPTEKDENGNACMSCHVTGWGQESRGGFMDAEKSKDLLGVGCEACHGPGSKHIEAGKAVIDAKQKHFPEGAKKFIQRKSTACSNCHNPHVSHAKYKEG